MKNRLNQLLEVTKERKTVERLLTAKDVKEAYYSEKAAMADTLKLFADECNLIGEGFYEAPTDIITEDNAIDISIILMMSRVDDSWLFGKNYCTLVSALKRVMGPKAVVARRIAEYLEGDKINLFTETPEDELLMKLIV